MDYALFMRERGHVVYGKPSHMNTIPGNPRYGDTKRPRAPLVPLTRTIVVI